MKSANLSVIYGDYSGFYKAILLIDCARQSPVALLVAVQATHTSAGLTSRQMSLTTRKLALPRLGRAASAYLIPFCWPSRRLPTALISQLIQFDAAATAAPRPIAPSLLQIECVRMERQIRSLYASGCATIPADEYPPEAACLLSHRAFCGPCDKTALFTYRDLSHARPRKVSVLERVV